MATHSRILVWKISWIEESDRLQSTGLQRAGHNGALTHSSSWYTASLLHQYANAQFVQLQVFFYGGHQQRGHLKKRTLNCIKCWWESNKTGTEKWSLNLFTWNSWFIWNTNKNSPLEKLKQVSDSNEILYKCRVQK